MSTKQSSKKSTVSIRFEVSSTAGPPQPYEGLLDADALKTLLDSAPSAERSKFLGAEIAEALDRNAEQVSQTIIGLITEVRRYVTADVLNLRNRKPNIERLRIGQFIDEEKKQKKTEGMILREILHSHPEWVEEYDGKPLKKKVRTQVLERLRKIWRDYYKIREENPTLLDWPKVYGWASPDEELHKVVCERLAKRTASVLKRVLTKSSGFLQS